MKIVSIVGFVFVGVIACSSGAGAGESCSTDGDCAGGVKCLHDKYASNGQCVDVPAPIRGACSLACTTSAQCKVYGSTFKCALAQTDVACNPTGICRDNYTCTTPGCRLAPDN